MKTIVTRWLFQSCFIATFILMNCHSDESADVAWKKDAGNPILKRGMPYEYDFYAISDCWVINQDGVYMMWYTAGGAVLPDEKLKSRIALATSSDGVSWKKYENNPVLDITYDGWDSLGVETVSVLVDNDDVAEKRFKMWYAGQTLNDYRYEIGYAYSADGIHWIKHRDAVLNVGAANEWDNCFIEGPSVIKIDGIYKMWYAGYDCEINGDNTDGKVCIGYATSTDGLHWTKNVKPVLYPSSSGWDQVSVQDPHVLLDNGIYHMWYGGTDRENNYYQQTGYAYSDDGLTWTVSADNPIIKRGNVGDWDANTASFPAVLIEGNTVKLWYTGKDVDPLPAPPTSYFWEIGYAERKRSGTKQIQ